MKYTPSLKETFYTKRMNWPKTMIAVTLGKTYSRPPNKPIPRL